MGLRKSFHWTYAIVLGLLAVSIFHPDWHIEFAVFRAPDRPMMYFFYVLPIFRFLGMIPEPLGYGLLSAWTVVSLYFGVRLFGGKGWMAFSAVPVLWLLLFGQTDGLAAGGIVLAWYALQKKRPYLLGLGLIIASIKPQATIGLMLLIWWWSPSRIKSLVIPALVVSASFVIWGFWIPEWLRILQSMQGEISRVAWNYSWWPFLGPVIWLLWPAVLPLRMERVRKLIAIGAVSMLTVPYFPFYSAILFYAMPVPAFFYWASQLIVIGTLFGPRILDFMRLLPMALLVWAVYPSVIPLRWQGWVSASWARLLPAPLKK